MLALLPAAALAGSVALARTHWFLLHGMPPYLRGLDAEFHITGRSCDVLVFGDSSALTGIEPRLVSQQTGLRACSIAQTKGTTGVTGVSFLSMYLSRNPPPRFLVIAFAPEDWHPVTAWGEVAYVEGVTQLARHYPLPTLLRQLATHPDSAFGFATFVYKQAIGGLRGRLADANQNADPSQDEGHMTLPLPAEQRCESLSGAPLPFFRPDAAYMQHLREQFSSAATRVLLVVPPVPECDPQRERYLAQLRPDVDGTFPALPVTDYNDLDRHFTREGSAKYSADVSQLILHTMEAQH